MMSFPRLSSPSFGSSVMPVATPRNSSGLPASQSGLGANAMLNPSGIAPLSPANTPLGISPVVPTPLPLTNLVAQLGSQTQMRLDGTIQYNEPLTRMIAGYGTLAVPPLQALFESTTRITALLEGLDAAQKIAESPMVNPVALQPLAKSLQRWNSHPDPSIQMQLARFYRKINDQRSFGPTLSTLVNYALTQYAMQSSPNYNVTEEAGLTVLDLLARRTAAETVRQLLPFLPGRSVGRPMELPQSLPSVAHSSVTGPARQ